MSEEIVLIRIAVRDAWRPWEDRTHFCLVLSLLTSTMAPKKASDTDAPAVEPRRSGRIASMPVPPTEVTVKPKASRATKKRPAEEVPTTEVAAASSSKKVVSYEFQYYPSSNQDHKL